MAQPERQELAAGVERKLDLADTLSSLFDVTSAQLIDRMRASTDRHLMLNLGNGAVVCARVHFRRATLAEGSRPTDVHDAAAPAAAASATVKPVASMRPA